MRSAPKPIEDDERGLDALAYDGERDVRSERGAVNIGQRLLVSLVAVPLPDETIQQVEHCGTYYRIRYDGGDHDGEEKYGAEGLAMLGLHPYGRCRRHRAGSVLTIRCGEEWWMSCAGERVAGMLRGKCTQVEANMQVKAWYAYECGAARAAEETEEQVEHARRIYRCATRRG